MRCGWEPIILLVSGKSEAEACGRELTNCVAANGFVTMDISSQMINVEYYARDMTYEGGDLYPVACDLEPSYSFQITQKAT